MLTLKKSTLAALMLASIGLSGGANALVIDSFDADNGAIASDSTDDGGAVLASDGPGLSGVLGGVRELSANMTAGEFLSNAIYSTVDSGFFRSAHDVDVTGVSKVFWDGKADGVLSTSGADFNFDLKSDGATLFELVMDYDLTGGPIGLTLWDTAGTAATSFFSSVAGSAKTSTLDFSQFGSLIDFRHISAIELSMEMGLDRDLRLDSLKTISNGSGGGGSVPEPATLALIGLGLLGLRSARRSRDAA